MAPTKRSRRVVDDEGQDGDVIDVQEARSNFRPEGSRKRARVTIDEPSKEDTPEPERDDDSSSESDDEGRRREPDSPLQTQYELMRDAGFKHLQYTDLDDMQATQRLANRPTTLGNNMVAESGIIESITCFNFMCHERLHVELGPLINFIVGENGSGKSAVLTALTLCLGGKASDTNRGGSLKSFVKEGRDHGRLVVKIKNAGSDAYQPDIYGNSIIVERHFSKTGSSGFKIKSATDRIISTKKQEVDEISEWYALQIGNPLTVLSQDNARQFLNSATPAQKYKYFVSGVQLEQLDNDYKMSQDTLDKTLVLRDDLTGKITYVKKQMDDAQRLAETAQKNQSLREKARLYRAQLVWSQVVEQERLLQEREKAILDREKLIIDAEKDRDIMTEALVKAEEKLERLQQARQELMEEQETFDDRIAKADTIYQTVKKELTDLHREERDAHLRIKNAKDAIRSCEAKIREEEHRLGESTGSVRAQKDAELAQATAKERLVKEHIDENSQKLPDLERQLDDAQQSLNRRKGETKGKRDEIVVAEQQVRQLEQSTGSPYDGFNRDIMNLVKNIASDQGFQHKPIGPLGAHIRLTKPEWSGILEKTLGDGLNAFVVRSKADQTRLSSMMRKGGLQRPPPIYIAYGGQIDTRAQEPDPQFDTILRVLEFEDEIIRSQLIINNSIEKIILVRDRKEAESIMIDRGPPRNVAACLCFHDGRGKRGHGIRITNRNGTIGTSPIKPSNQRPRMQSDSVRQVALQKEHLTSLGRELRDIMAEERKAQQTQQRCAAQLKTHSQDIKRLEGELRRTQADMERVQMELDAFEGVDDRLNVLRGDLELRKTEADQIGDQYGAMVLAKRELNVKTEEAKRRLEDERGEKGDWNSRVRKADEKLKTADNMRRIAVSKKNETFERIDIEKGEKRRAEMKRDDKAREVEEFTTQALEMAPDRVHIPDDETYQTIERKYEKIREQLKQREKRLGATDEEIYDRASEARERYGDVMRQTKDVDETIDSLKRAIESRLENWRKFQRQISARIRIQFNYLLSERGFRGKIDLDHKAKKVNLQIEPDETRKSAAGRNTKTLSGGEKSFSSICMLLSIWEAIGSPIRCLDEFDVFMDNVNRAISTNMLVDAARRSVSRQYILITPNAIEGRAKLDKDVKIIRLTDPRQRTLV